VAPELPRLGHAPGGGRGLPLILLYKIGDTAMGPMVRPFWVDRGLTLTDIAFVTTAFGLGATVVGALVGGILTSRIGVFRALLVFGLLQAVSNLGYATAAWAEAGRPGIYAASLVESFTGGLGTAAFLSFLMNVCDKDPGRDAVRPPLRRLQPERHPRRLRLGPGRRATRLRALLRADVPARAAGVCVHAVGARVDPRTSRLEPMQ
jgi:hypothetical protein